MTRTQLEVQTIGRLQQRLLPHPLPQHTGWELAVQYEVGKSGGGDYYDLLAMQPGYMGIVVADVTGHGPAAAVLMAMTRMLLHACPITSGQRRDPYCYEKEGCRRSPDVVLAHLNRVLVDNSLDDQFMTMVFAIVNLITGEVQFSNAGHMTPLLHRAGGGILTALPQNTGLPLGVDAEASYDTTVLQMSPGDTLVFYTDGLTEAQDCRGEMFAQQRLEGCVLASAHQDANAMKVSMMRNLREFLGESNLHDDLTLLILKRTVTEDPLASEFFIG